MKLIRCYIENFGGLHQYTVDFNEGLTVICEPNGFGKTTLAEFIRAMFYGFPRAGKDLSKNLRMKYSPWQGGRYGGYLVFEHEGTRYRIDRSFGDVPKNDTFKLTSEDTHRESRKFTANIGLELFGLDADSFIRSTYMPQLHDNGSLSTDNIRAKLGNLLEDTGDLGSYEKALQKLKDKRSLYERFRGNGGSVNEARRMISELQQQITQCEGKRPTLERLTADLDAAKQEQLSGESALQQIRSQLSEATTAEADAALSREYEKLCRDKSHIAQELGILTNRYPKGIPTTEALEAAAKRMEQYAADRHPEFAKEDQARMEAAAAYFAAGIPKEDDIRLAEQTLSRAEALRMELTSAAPVHDAPQKKFHSLFFPVLLVGILAAAAGVYLFAVPLFDSHSLIGGICGGLGLMGVIAAAMLQNNHSLMSKLQTRGQSVSAGENERTAAMLEAEVDSFLAPYPTRSGSLRSRLAEVNDRRILYLHLLDREAMLKKQTEERDERMAALTLAHHTFCTAYGLRISIDDRRAWKEMERDAEAFRRLTRELTAANKALTDFIAEHGHRPASALKHTDHSLEERKDAEQKLIHKQNALHAHIVQLEQQCRLLRTEIDRIPQLTDELTRQIQRRDADTERVRLLDSTAAFLEQARESLSTSYMGSVQRHFVRHLSHLTGEQPNRIAVNSDLEVQLERMGSARPLSQFSAGQNDAVQLCMRLALADALFESGSCFMILDDPFVNLDDHHTARALALLKELSKNRQIIYLVCNSSRI